MRHIKKSRLGLRVDTLFLAGRFPTDTVALRLDNFVIRGKDRGIETKALATAYLAMNSYGRMKLPVAMDARISFPEDTVRKIRIERFNADFADIPLSAQGDVAFKGDSLYIKGIPLHKLIVTSVMRTKDDVRKLRTRNGNATENSCHLYGTTFDICYNRYKTVADPDGPQLRPTRNDTLKWVLSEVLRDFREQGRCHIKYEVKQGCFHITVNN